MTWMGAGKVALLNKQKNIWGMKSYELGFFNVHGENYLNCQQSRYYDTFCPEYSRLCE